MQRNKIPARHVVLGVTNSVEELLRRRAQPLQLHVADEDAQLNANSFWLTRAIANLVRSASDASDDGMPITLTFEAAGEDFEVRIRNVGTSVDAHRLHNICEHYGPADRDGITLAVASKIVGLHGGRVAAERLGPGLGMVYTVRLPLESPTVELATV